MPQPHATTVHSSPLEIFRSDSTHHITPNIMSNFLTILLVLISVPYKSLAFVPSNDSLRMPPAKSAPLHLAPLSNFSECTFLKSPQSFRICIDERGTVASLDDDGRGEYVLGIADENDLPDVARLTVDAFGDVAITLGGDLSNLERALLSPGVSLWNGYTDIFAYTEVLSGLRSRMKDKLGKVDLSPPPIEGAEGVDSELIAANSSLILAVARPKPGSSSGLDTIATVELRLQPTDAKIPFSQPWLDSIERKLAKKLGIDLSRDGMDNKLQPYLSNLCVSEGARGLKVGTALVRCLEKIASEEWGYDKLYLHVDLENTAALNLYKKEEYEDVGFRWRAPWAGGATDIGYFVKKFR